MNGQYWIPLGIRIIFNYLVSVLKFCTRRLPVKRTTTFAATGATSLQHRPNLPVQTTIFATGADIAVDDVQMLLFIEYPESKLLDQVIFSHIYVNFQRPVEGPICKEPFTILHFG